MNAPSDDGVEHVSFVEIVEMVLVEEVLAECQVR